MAIVQQNQWFPNALRTEPGQTIYGATPWQTMQKAYQAPQGQLASNAAVGQPIAQQPYQAPTIRTKPDMSPVQSTVRPPGTMPTLATASPPADTGGTGGGDDGSWWEVTGGGDDGSWWEVTGGEEDKVPPGYIPPPAPQPTPQPTPQPSTGNGILPPLAGPYDPTGQNAPTTPANLGYKWVWNPATYYWMQVVINEPSKPTGGGYIPGPEATPNPPVPGGGAIPEPGYPPTQPAPPTLNPYAWGDPRYGRYGASTWDWSQGPPSADTPGGFWIKSPWAERNPGTNWGNYVDTVYVPEGMTFGQFLAANPWFYNVSGGAGEQVRDLRLKQYLENLLAEINMRGSDQYNYRPGAVGAQQVVNMNPSEKEMLMGKWSAMGLSGDDMWQMMLRAMPTGGAETKTTWA